MDARVAAEAAAQAQGSDPAAPLEGMSVVSLAPLARAGQDGFIGWIEAENVEFRAHPQREAVRLTRARIQANPQDFELGGGAAPASTAERAALPLQ